MMQLWAYTNALNVALRCRIMNTMIFVHIMNTMIFVHGVEIKLRGGSND